MFSPTQIVHVAKKAAAFAARVLPVTVTYTVELINDPSITEDGLLDTHERKIILNLAQLRPFTVDSFVDRPGTPPENMLTPDQKEKWGMILKICSLTFHEMRHLYQVTEVRAYTLNKAYGRLVPQHESIDKCERWLKELTTYKLNENECTEVEKDADDFAYYMSNRYPFVNELLKTNRRIGAFKRKYDKVLIDRQVVTPGQETLMDLVNGEDLPF